MKKEFERIWEGRENTITRLPPPSLPHSMRHRFEKEKKAKEFVSLFFISLLYFSVCVCLGNRRRRGGMRLFSSCLAPGPIDPTDDAAASPEKKKKKEIMASGWMDGGGTN